MNNKSNEYLYTHKGRMNFKGLLSTSSDTCCRATAGGNDETSK